MKITAFRETIAGIEVVDAVYADHLLTAAAELAAARDLVYNAKHDRRVSKELFGKKSEEVALWDLTMPERVKVYIKKWELLRRAIKKANPIEVE